MKTDESLLSCDDTSSGNAEMNVPPPPPPPMPFRTLFTYEEYTINQPVISHATSPEEAKLLWMHRMFYDEDKPSEFALFDLNFCLQKGPNCGLAALCMAASAVSRDLDMDDVFMEAKLHGFTKQGEMFSADNMAFLATLKLEPRFNVELLAGGLASHKQHILDSIRKGAVVLVPYDADKDNSPCCKKGHKAHWAVICGFAKVSNSTSSLFVYARQGKSKHMSLWDFEMLVLSNNNLTEFNPKRAESPLLYVLPEGGVEAGLSGKAVLLHFTQKPDYTNFNLL